MPQRDLVVLGGSAGGFEALLQLLDELPTTFPAAIAIVLHIPAQGTGLLPTVIQRRCPLAVSYAEDREPIPYGRVVIAPPDHHLVVMPDKLRTLRGPRENRHRPAIDPLFRSAAENYGERTIGVLLSGSGSDGAVGMSAIRRGGGYLIVQHPDSAPFPSMPLAAIDAVEVDEQLYVEEIASRLAALVSKPYASRREVLPAMNDSDQLRNLVPGQHEDLSVTHTPSEFSCPDCGGVLWQRADEQLAHFRCRVGHAYSTESLLAAQDDMYEAALWTSLRALEEKAELFRRMASQADERGHAQLRDRMRERGSELEPHIETLRGLLAS